MTAKISILALLTIVCVLSRSEALADSDSAGEYTGRGHQVGKRMRVGGAGGKDSGTIHGHCILAEGNGNPVAGPCVAVVLVLTDDKGNEIRRTRTSKEGDFEFTGDKNAQYRVVAESRSYEAVGAVKSVRAGDRLNLRLRYK